MSGFCRVHLLPALFEPAELRGGIAVIVDILRASTTITHALTNGAQKVIPCLSIDDALALRTSQGDEVLLGGERGGIRIDGFDLSNSPDDYSNSVVARKAIGFTTTNGTKALLRSEQAQEIIIGSFANFSKVLERVVDSGRPIHVVCAGTNDAVTGEDVLFAGAVVHQLLERNYDCCDSAQIAHSYWKLTVGSHDNQAIEEAIRSAQGGKNLIALGYEKDITTASQVDSVSTLGTCRDGAIFA